MTINPRNFLLTTTFTISALAIAVAGCGTDPNGSTGGTGGAGGNTGGGTGGASATLGPIKGMALETFDTSAGTFVINTFADPSNLGGTGNPTAAATTAVWDGTEGSPSPGSLKVSAPFSGWNQNVDFRTATLMPVQNWTGKKFHVRVKVASGFVNDMYVQGGAQPYVKTGTAYTWGSVWTNIAAGSQWQEFTIDLSTLTAIDPTMVIEFGMQLASGAGNTMAALPTPATFYVDSFSIE